MARLAEALAAMRRHRAPSYGKVAFIDGGGTSRGTSCEAAVLDSALRNLAEAASRDQSVSACGCDDSQASGGTMENVPDHARTVRNGSITMLAAGVLLFILSVVYLIPHDMGVTSALRSRGVHAQAVVTECAEVSRPEDNPAGNSHCQVRFTTSDGTSVEVRLAYVTGNIAARDTVTVVYDPRHTGTVALLSSIGYWNSLVRNALDVVALVASVVMTLLGLAVHLWYRWVTRAGARPRPSEA